ncbi:alpha/beta hydrolase fold domain-containing protein [bacterium]|nr:alpha/beta hydrolase fold domain-containing protein [bacterium]
MTFAPGMEEALRRHESFAREDEAVAFWAETAPQVPTVEMTYPGGAGQPQTVRLYRGHLPAPAPVILYIHGGGWVGGSIAINDPAVRALVAESGWSAVSISYRFAPQHPYPAALQDVGAALRWLRDKASGLGLDAGRVAIGGASAGANLAAAAALAEPEGSLAGMVLFYGIFGADMETASYSTHADGPGLTRARMAEFFDLYDPVNLRRTDAMIAPALAPSLRALPPALLVVAEIDVLADDSRAFATRLRAEQVPTEVIEVAGVTHGFINRGRMVPAARDTLTRAAAFLSTLEPRR